MAADWTAAWTLSIVLTAHRSSSCREGNGGAFDGAFDGVVDAAVSSGLEERPSEFGGAGNTLGRFSEGEADDELGGEMSDEVIQLCLESRQKASKKQDNQGSSKR